MKRFLIVSVLALAATLIGAQDIKISAGSTIGLGLTNNHGENSTQKQDIGYTTLNINAFLDFTYGEVAVGYLKSIGDGKVKLSGSVTNESTLNMAWSFAAFSAYLKYPFVFDALSVEPKFGVQYDLPISLLLSGTDAPADIKKDYNDLYLGLGANLKYDVVPGIYLTLPVTFNYCLTATPTYNPPAGVTWSQYTINVALGAGFKF